MAGYSQASSIAAYKSVATHGVAIEADPHQLISMLMDGALDRLVSAKGCIERGEVVQKAALLHRVGAILDELRSSLDHSVGGEVSANLDRLYDYMMRRVMTANLKSDVAAIDEVVRLLREIRNAWGSIPAEAPGTQVIAMGNQRKLASGTIGEVIADKMLQVVLMQRVVGCTHELVDQALQANWLSVLEGMDVRRQLLESVIECDYGQFNAEVQSLIAAVAESERALTSVVAHAIASGVERGAEFAMYH